MAQADSAHTTGASSLSLEAAMTRPGGRLPIALDNNQFLISDRGGLVVAVFPGTPDGRRAARMWLAAMRAS
jgi:hypothetical protein